MTHDSAALPEARFIFRSYAGALFWLFVALVGSFIAFGLFAPYWNKALANFLMVREAYLYNEGDKQLFLHYPAHLSPKLLGLWYQLLQAVSLIPQYKWAELLGASTAAEFDATWQQLVGWGYVEAFLIGCLYVFVSIALIRRLTGIWQVAVLAGITLAFSDAIALAYRNLRGTSEMLSSALVFVALLLACVAAREAGSARRFLYLGLAGALVSVAMTEKVLALLPALTIPVIALTFGKDESNFRAPVSRSEWLRAIVLCAVGLALLFPTLSLLEQGTGAMATSHMIPVVPGHDPVYYRALSGGLSGVYQWLLVLYVVCAMLAYAWIYRVRPIDAAIAVMAVLVGLALGFLTLHWRFDIASVVAVSNPIEHLKAASGSSSGHGPTTSVVGLAGKLLGGFGNALAVHSFFLHPSHRPTLLIEWLSFFAAFVLWRRGEIKAALQIVMLLLAAIAIDASFGLRAGMGGGIKIYYIPYTDPFIVLAGAMALTAFYKELISPKAQKAIVALMLVYVVWGHFEPSRAAYGVHKKAKVCGLVSSFIEGIHIPYCQPSKTPAASDG